MKKKNFTSWLFRREIQPAEPDFFAIVKGELLYRIAELREKNCGCMKCADDLKKYEEALKKLK